MCYLLVYRASETFLLTFESQKIIYFVFPLFHFFSIFISFLLTLRIFLFCVANINRSLPNFMPISNYCFWCFYLIGLLIESNWTHLSIVPCLISWFTLSISALRPFRVLSFLIFYNVNFIRIIILTCYT